MFLDKQLAALDLTKVPEKTLLSVLSAIENELVSRSLIASEERSDVHRFFKRKRGLRSQNERVSFETLDMEDWSYLFPGGSTERKFYVYAHSVKGSKKYDFQEASLPFGLTRLPFYIGKGTGDRAYDLKRNQGHGATIRGLSATNRPAKPPSVRILRDNLTESEAFALESKLVYFFGTKYEIGKSGVLVNLDVPKRPDWCLLRRHGTTCPTNNL